METDLQFEILLAVGLAIHLVGGYFLSLLGKKRRIGKKWSLYFCWTLGLLLGLILILISPKFKSNQPEFHHKKSLKIIGTTITVISALAYANYGALATMGQIKFNLIAFVMTFGYLGLGIYIHDLGEGKSFASGFKE
ncbi:MAG: hypothetical protein AAFP76_10355 [Bacteroidota bacterium]